MHCGRQKGDVKAARKHLAVVFEAAAFCVGGKLLEAAVMLEERDYGGVVALTGQARPHLPRKSLVVCAHPLQHFTLTLTSLQPLLSQRYSMC